MIIDTHEHCYNPKSKDCWAAGRMAEFASREIKFVEISINCSDIDDMVSVIMKYDPCLGIVPGEHPKLIQAETDISQIYEHVTDRILRYKEKVLGLKTGLDYYWVEEEAARENQRRLVRMFLEYAAEQELPVVIHVRSAEEEKEKADQDLLSILSEIRFKGNLVLHCYNGSKEIADKYLKVNPNTYFGIGGAVTYEDSADLAEAVCMIPRERILLETDGPYMKPLYPDLTRPAGKKNSSLNLPIVIEKLAKLLECTPEEIEKITTRNACVFYKLGLDLN